MEEFTLRLVIHGRVQGVCYRAWMEGTARSLGVDGWVRNRKDGTVEALIIGKEKAVDTLIAHCHEGPPAARVEQVTVESVDDIAPRGIFEQKPTE